MNKARRKIIQEIIDQITDLQAELEQIQEEEGVAYDNLPESFQDSEKGEQMSNAVSNLDSAYSSIEEVLEYLNEAIQ